MGGLEEADATPASDGRSRMNRTFWTERNVFVTGVTGLLGSWLAEELLARDANVICLVRDWVPQSRFVARKLPGEAVLVRGELEDLDLLRRAVNEYEVDTIFHLGAQTIVGTAVRSALSTFESNIRGTWNLMEACRSCGALLERIVVASSDKAYGPHAKLPYSEDAPLQGIYPYDVSKSCADLIALSYFHTYGAPVCVTRCGNLFGGGDLNFNRLVPGTIRSALRGERPVIRSDGKYVRDYFYVADAVEAYLHLAEHMEEDRCIGEAFNFGNETPLSVLEIVERILELTGRPDLEPRILDEVTTEISEQYLDCSKAREVLRWKPRYALDEGLQTTIEWYSDWLEAD